MNVRYGLLKEVPSSICVLCKINGGIYRPFPCGCYLPIHENCGVAIVQQGSFTCPKCLQIRVFVNETPGTSVIDESFFVQRPTQTLYRCDKSSRALVWCLCLIIMALAIALIIFIYLHYNA